VLAAV
jgi:protein JBTS26